MNELIDSQIMMVSITIGLIIGAYLIIYIEKNRIMESETERQRESYQDHKKGDKI